jgi:hypothetical protein
LAFISKLGCAVNGFAEGKVAVKNVHSAFISYVEFVPRALAGVVSNVRLRRNAGSPQK